MAEFSRDELSGLPNLIGLISDMGTLPQDRCALIGFDIKNLQHVNDKYGEHVGNEIIEVMGSILRETCATVDMTCHAYRLGGDEFVLALHGADVKQARLLADNVVDSFRETLLAKELENELLSNECHRAIVLQPEDGKNLSELLIRLRLKLFGTLADDEQKPLPPWVEGLFSHLIRRFNETISELRRTEHLARTDAISGLPNHRAAQSALTDLISSSIDNGTPFTVLFIDGDKLKQYNEVYGYEAGNEMIRKMGQVLVDNVRLQDQVYRWLSGDEFLVILPEVEQTEALSVAERLRSKVQDNFVYSDIPVTISIGVATFPDAGTDVDELLAKVTRATYLAKQAGRNRIHVMKS